MSWREHSQYKITEALLEYEAQKLCLREEVDRNEMSEVIQKAYPFGARTNHPYQQWLKAVKQVNQLLDNGVKISELTKIDWDKATGFGKRVNQSHVPRQRSSDTTCDGQLSLL
jgi:hypothetical protein